MKYKYGVQKKSFPGLKGKLLKTKVLPQPFGNRRRKNKLTWKFSLAPAVFLFPANF